MPGPIVYIDRSVIRSPDLGGLRQAVTDLVAFVREREAQLLVYGFAIDEATSTMQVVAVHPDAESLELHLGIGGPEFRKVGAFIDLQRIDVYGEATPAIHEQLRQKAAILGTDARIDVHALVPGFERLSGALDSGPDHGSQAGPFERAG